MDRFPEKYEKPELLSINAGLNIGWSAACNPGKNPGTGGARCTVGAGVVGGPDDVFLNSDYMQQTERRSGL